MSGAAPAPAQCLIAPWRVLALRSAPVAVARLDEAALGLQRRDVGAGQLLRDFRERGAARCEPLDKPLVDGLVLAVLLLAVGGGDVS